MEGFGPSVVHGGRTNVKHLLLACRFPLLLAAVLVLVGGLPLRAQDTWFPAFSATTQNLWHVAHGGGQFIAVGEGGTILTSPDGTAWTNRVSGNALWLVAAGYGDGRFIVVGDRGTILTSPDGVAWTARASGTTARLNGIAYGGGRWLAVAESGELLTSTDAIAWIKLSPSADRLHGIVHAYGQFVITGDNGLMRVTIDTTDYDTRVLPEGLFVEAVTYARRGFVAVGADGYIIASSDATTWRRVASGTTSYLRGVAFFNGRFIAAGTGGTVLTSASAEGPWIARSTGTTALLTAATASDAAAIVVGFGGTILRAAPAVSPPIINEAPASTIAVAGDNVIFAVTATGTLPLAYQWRLNGTPLPGQTADRLFLPNAQPAQAGAYTVSVANAQGVTTSAAAALTFVASTAPGPIVDQTFAPTLTISGNINAAVEQADGKVIIGGAQFFVTPGVSPFALARLNLDGSLDSTFNTGSGLSAGGRVNQLLLQADSRILILGAFSTVNGIARRNLARLNSDGTVDQTFAAVDAATAFSPIEMSLQRDGKIIVLTNGRLHRLNPDGSADASFAFPASGLFITRHTVLATGKIIVADTGSGFVLPNPLCLLNQDGSVAPSFVPIPAPSFSLDVGSFPALFALSDGGLLAQSSFSRRGIINSTLTRYAIQGSGEQPWQGISIGGFFQSLSSVFSPTAQGKIYHAYSASASPGPDLRLLHRYNSDGKLDLSFDARGGPDGGIGTILPLANGQVLVTGNFTTFDGVVRPRLARLFASNALSRPSPAVVSLTPEAAAVRPGEPVTLAIAAAGSGPLTYQWSDNIPAADRAKSTVQVPTAISGTYTFTATITNAVGSVVSAPVRVVVAPSAPIILSAPTAATVSLGRTATLAVTAGGSAPFTYQWFRGTMLVGTGATLTIASATAADAGDYSVVVRNSLGATTSAIARLAVDGSPQLVNISTRATAGTGDRALIAGFVVRGAADKRVVVRGLGPALASFGLPGTLPDPVLTLRDDAGRVLATNNNWDATATPPALFASLGAFALINASADAALQISLLPGGYTATVADTASRPGTALVEIYEADTNNTRLVNLSTRAFVDTGSAIGIAGIVVRGAQAGRYLIRGAGPALTAFGVGGALADPVLVLTTSLGVTVASNDNWSANTNAGEITGAAAVVGAFPFAGNSRDAALFLTLPPGSYTALVSGAANTTGVALVEVYEVP
jgi:uncharacterized delta-60 repeat protein